MDLKQNIKRYIGNIPGWNTRRKIVVIESDDWGSVYMSTKDAFNKLISAGFDFSKNQYLNNDCLESNADMEGLYDVLSQHKDSTGRNPVITGLNLVANPDFKKIKDNGFTKYEYESFFKTCNHYDGRNRIPELYKEGIDKRLFIPAFHGREHLNVSRWMRLLQENNKTIKTIFEYQIPYVSSGINGESIPNLRAAFDMDSMDDLAYLQNVIHTGISEFENMFGFRTHYFVPTNGYFNNTLQSVLCKEGFHAIGLQRQQIEPKGDGIYEKHYSWLGKKTPYGLLNIARNCFFEPNSWEHPKNKDWVNDCLHQINIAFRCFKPAIIGNHRVNFTGSLNPENRTNGLEKLNSLLSQIIKRWSNIEFMTSEELINLMLKK